MGRDCRQLAEADAENAAVGIESSGHLRDVLDDLKHGVDVGQAATASSRDVLRFLQPSDEPDSIGRLDSYEIHEVVGAGGMGVVLRGWDPTLRRVVAIKVLAAHLANSAAAERRFVREAQAAAAVTHDHVVAIHAVESGHEPPYLVMQYIEGKTLQQRLDATGPLEVKEILRIGQQTAQGLAAAHRQGIVHRDIKPANILLENGVERVRITDFGLARAIDDASMTQSGVVAGTPLFMAPEQAQGQPVDHRSDLFSLGSVLYAMATGRPPFRSSTMMGVIRRVCDDEARPIRENNPDVPDWLCGIIDRLLAKNPAERFQSADEVAELLAGCLAHAQHPLSVPMPQLALKSVSESLGERTIDASPTEGARPVDQPPTVLSELNATHLYGRHEVGERETSEESEVLEAARRLVRWPAVFLFGIAMLNCCLVAALVSYQLAGTDGIRAHFGQEHLWILMPSGFCMIGALRMARLSSKVWAYIAVAMSLMGPAMILAVMIGIWALVRLSRPEVSAGFGVLERRRLEGRGRSSQSSGFGRQLARLLIITILWLMAIAIPLAFYVLTQDSGAFPNVGLPERMMLGLAALAVVFGLSALLRVTEKKSATSESGVEGGPSRAQILRRVPEVLLCTILAMFTMIVTYSDLTPSFYDRFREAAILPLFCMTIVALSVVAFINRRRIRELEERGQDDPELRLAFRSAIWIPVGSLVPLAVLLSLWAYRQSTVGYVTVNVDDPMSIVTFRNSTTGEKLDCWASWKRVRLQAGKYEWTVSDGPMESIVLESGLLDVHARTGQVLTVVIDKSESIRRLEGSWKYTTGSVQWGDAGSAPPDWALPPGTLGIQWNEHHGLHTLVFAPKAEQIAVGTSDDFRVYACRVRADVYPKKIWLLEPNPDQPPEEWPCVADGYWRVGTNGLYLMLRPPGQADLPSSYSIPADLHVHYQFERLQEAEVLAKIDASEVVESPSKVASSALAANDGSGFYAEIFSVEGAAGTPIRAEISLGVSDGLRPGEIYKFMVQNDDGRRSAAGTIQVEKVFVDRATVRLLDQAFEGQLTTGDVLILDGFGKTTGF